MVPMTPIPMNELIKVLLRGLGKCTILVFDEDNNRVFLQAMHEGTSTGWLLYNLDSCVVVRASDNWETILEEYVRGTQKST